MIFPKFSDKLNISPLIVFRLIFGASPHSCNCLLSKQPVIEINNIIIKNRLIFFLLIIIDFFLYVIPPS